jgi:hypothetical protein
MLFKWGQHLPATPALSAAHLHVPRIWEDVTRSTSHATHSLQAFLQLHMARPQSVRLLLYCQHPADPRRGATPRGKPSRVDKVVRQQSLTPNEENTLVGETTANLGIYK